jgi:hypothetical protein
MITAKALTTIDISLAYRTRVPLDGLTSAGTQQYPMELSPTQVETITGDPIVQIHAAGIDAAAHISLSVELTIENRNTGATFVTGHSFGDVHLSPDAPAFTAPMPRTVLVPAGGSALSGRAAPTVGHDAFD